MPEQALNIQIIPPGVKRWNGRTVLSAHGCVLLERFTGKSYSYWVVNMKTGANAHICHKKAPVPEAEREAIIERFLAPKAAPAAASGSEYCIDTERGDKREELSKTLTHIFETLMPQHGYNLRPEQLELAKDVLEALHGRAVLLAEAG